MHDETIAIRCNSGLLKRCEELRGFLGERSLRGSASRSDVIRSALAIGLAELEDQKEGGGE